MEEKSLKKAHTAEHLLFGSFKKIKNDLEIEKIELGLDESKIYIKGDLSIEEIEKAQMMANEAAMKCLKVTESFEKKDEVINSRIKKDRIKGDIARIISIGDYDSAACSGEHVSSTKEIGAIAIIGIKKDSPATTIVIFCTGEKAIFELIKNSSAAIGASRLLNESIPSLIKRVDSMKNELESAKKSHRDLSQEFFEKSCIEKINNINYFESMNADLKKAVSKAEELKEKDCSIFLINDSIIISGKKSQKAFLLFKKKFSIKGGGRDIIVGKICEKNPKLIKKEIESLEL